jgi:tellurite resistance protein TerC
VTTALGWAVFAVFVAVMLALDLGVFHRRAHEVRVREALLMVALWVSLALLFNAGVWVWRGRQAGMEFLAGYLLEYSLSVDNIFVFLLIFGYFRVPRKHQHRVLFWGIMGALIMRGLLIGAGVALIRLFHWVIYLFGAFLVLTGIKMFFQKEGGIDPDRNPVVRLASRLLPLAKRFHEERFWVREEGKWLATPLFLVLLVVETTDVVFAFDSIPAIFGVTRDGFIVFTSNVFAIMGLRSLYFALAGVMDLFRFLKHGVSVVLVFVGVKIFLGETAYRIPTGMALGVLAGILAVSILASVVHKRWEERGRGEGPPPGRA